MTTVEEIKLAINKLSIEERAQIAAEICGWTDDNWYRQMKSDFAAGKFAAVNRDADSAHTTGQSVALDDILREP